MIRIAAVLAFAHPLAAEPPAELIEAMKKQARFIVVQISLGRQSGAGTGSGFPVDSQHLVTNFHVCCRVPKGAKTLIAVPVSETEMLAAQPVLVSAAKDLAILKLEKPLPGPVPELAPRKLLHEGQEVWAAGFPGASMRLGDRKAALDPSISKGVISKFLSMPVAKDLPPVDHVQMTAAVNPGNSGGPLFDECGRVAGVVVAKATTSMGATQTFAEGVNLAVQIDELLPELDRLKIPYRTASNACAVAGTSPFPLMQIGTFLAAAGALFVSLHKRTRSSVTQAARRLTQRVPAPPPAAAPKLYLRGVSGPYAGQRIPLSTKPCILGRDPQVANLVFPADSPHISKRHCQVYCDASGRAWIEDSWSSNGTFTAAGSRIVSGKAQELRKGERFYLGKPDASFEVIAE
jgi:hypothetical protein